MDGAYGGALVRGFGQAVGSLPTRADVQAALGVIPYDAAPWDMTVSGSFRNRLEGWINGPQLHNRVHVWVGGHMQQDDSPNDPVFFLHHANIDRLWVHWQALHTAEPYVNDLNTAMPPWATTPANMLDHRSLGYRYDTELRFVALRAADGHYLCAEGGGGGPVVANRTLRSHWERFELIEMPNGKIALRASNSKYVCAEGGGGGPVVADRSQLGPWEQFDLIYLGERRVALRANNGQYLCAESGGNDIVVANRSQVLAWETFELERLNRIGLRSNASKYVCAESGGGAYVVSDRAQLQAWETFDLIATGPGQIALRAQDGEFVCAESGGNDVVVANRGQIGSWERFALNVPAAVKIRLQAPNGRYIAAAATGPMRADKSTLVPECDFVVEVV